MYETEPDDDLEIPAQDESIIAILWSLHCRAAQAPVPHGDHSGH